MSRIYIFIFSVLLAMLDTFLPFIPPVTPTIGIIIPFLHPMWIYFFISSIGIGLGTVLILFLIKKLENKILKDKKITNKYYLKLQKYVDASIKAFGYPPILIFQATSLGALVAYSFLLEEKIDWVKYGIYTYLGRTLCLLLFVGTYKSLKFGNLILLVTILLYIVAFIYVIIIVFFRRHGIKEFKRLIKEGS